MNTTLVHRLNKYKSNQEKIKSLQYLSKKLDQIHPLHRKVQFLLDIRGYISMNNIIGSYVEFGCYECEMMYSAYNILEKNKEMYKYIGLDLFNNEQPEFNDEDLKYSQIYQDHESFISNKYDNINNFVKEYIGEKGILINGDFRKNNILNTLKSHISDKKINISVIDCNLISSIKTSIDFTLDNIVNGGVIFIDDYLTNVSNGPDVHNYLFESAKNKNLQLIDHNFYAPFAKSFIVFHKNYNFDDKLLDHILEYNENGFTIIRNVFNKEEFLNIINKIDEHIKNNKDELDIYYEKDGNTIKKIEKILYSNKEIMDYFNNNIIIKTFMKRIFEDDFILFKDKLNPKYSNKGSGWKMHVDGVFYSNTCDKGWWSYASMFINILIPLGDSKIENGTLKIVKIDKDNCSYEKLLENTDKKINNGVPKKEIYEKLEKNLIPLELNITDIAFFNPKCYHTSSKNISKKDRKVLYLTYNKLSDGDNYMKYYEEKSNSSNLGDHKKGDWINLHKF